MAQNPMAQVVELNKTTFMSCQASHNPQMDVTYVWYQGDMMIIFVKVFRLGENRYEIWNDPHFKAVWNSWFCYNHFVIGINYMCMCNMIAAFEMVILFNADNCELYFRVQAYSWGVCTSWMPNSGTKGDIPVESRHQEQF